MSKKTAHCVVDNGTVRGSCGITDLEHAKCKEWSAIINVLGERDSRAPARGHRQDCLLLPLHSTRALSLLQPTRLSLSLSTSSSTHRMRSLSI